MKIVKKYPDGIFSWIDLSTTDLAEAHAFYSGLFGWDVDDQPLPGGGSYTQFRIDGYSVAGAGQMMQEMLDAGAPSVWTSYVNIEDADAIAARAAEAGGVVFMPPMDVMDQGRMALIQDPTGAPFGIWQPAAHIGAQVVNQPNSLVWNELHTRHSEAANAFYRRVFGWTDEVDDSGYITWHQDGRLHCGAMKLAESWPESTPSNWMAYFLVDDLEAMVSRAIELGGSSPTGVVPAGELGHLAVIIDPQGAAFSVIKFNGPADPPPGTE